MRLPNAIIAMLSLAASLLPCLPLHAQTATAPPAPVPSGLQEQINTRMEIANPSPSPDGLTFYSVSGYDGPVVESFRPAEPHHLWKSSVVLTPDEKLIYCKTGTLLALTGKVIDGSFLHATLQLGHQTVAVDDVCRITQNYLFYWDAANPGAYLLRVVFVPDEHSDPVTTRVVHVIVSDTAPCSLPALTPSYETETAIPLIQAVVPGFKPAKTMIILNTTAFDMADPQKPLVIPASKMPAGTYPLSIASVTADGIRFVSMPQNLVIRHAP